jgi:hypothetical protein
VRALSKNEKPRLEYCANRRHECELRRNRAPGYHDPGNPSSRSNPFQNQVRWHLECKVAEEEDARAKSEHLGGKAQLLVHSERRKPDIDAIQKAMTKHKIRNGMRRRASLRDARRAAMSETFKLAVFMQNKHSPVAWPSSVRVDRADGCLRNLVCRHAEG